MEWEYLTDYILRELEGWLNGVSVPPRYARAVISPHAGYRYSGATAAHSFKQIDPATVRYFFSILSPNKAVYVSQYSFKILSTLPTKIVCTN